MKAIDFHFLELSDTCLSDLNQPVKKTDVKKLQTMSRPKIKLPFDALDKFLLAISIFSALGLVLLPAFYYDVLPDKIPMHFNGKGEVNRYGNKSEIWMLPVIGICLLALLWGISKVPHTFNYTVKITPENAAKQYGWSVKLMRVLAAIIGLGLVFIVWEIIKSALGQNDGLNPFFLPIFLAAVFGSIGYFLGKSMKN